MSDPICPRCGQPIHPGEEVEFDAPIGEQRIIVDGPSFHHLICPTTQVPA